MNLHYILFGFLIVFVPTLVGILLLHWYAGREIRRSEERAAAHRLAHELEFNRRHNGRGRS